MPMGIKNAPAIHQRRVTSALHPFIGRICHVYLDNIVVWSTDLDMHVQNVTTILQTLQENKLYCNPKKTKLFCMEIHFLGHWILATGIKADEGKADCILHWPVPTSAKAVHSFLGLVQYLNIFLPNLAKYTGVLNELTKKEWNKEFPPWTTWHQMAFNCIKGLACSLSKELDLDIIPLSLDWVSSLLTSFWMGFGSEATSMMQDMVTPSKPQGCVM